MPRSDASRRGGCRLTFFPPLLVDDKMDDDSGGVGDHLCSLPRFPSHRLNSELLRLDIGKHKKSGTEPNAIDSWTLSVGEHLFRTLYCP